MRKRFILFIFLATPVFGQTAPCKTDIECTACHSCQTPTHSNPCLKSCHRDKLIKALRPAANIPGKIILDEFKTGDDLYSPVVFSHQAHADMAEMSGGCTTCHHHDLPGEISPCKKCHDSERQRSDLYKPDLKASYHRLCLDCHSQWNDNDNCTNCHTVNGSMAASIQKGEAGAGEDGAGNALKLADRVYHTRSPLGRRVVLSHHDHHDVHGIDCADCHKNRRCASCHARDKSSASVTQPEKQRHQDCSGCHDTGKTCTRCHQATATQAFIQLTDAAQLTKQTCPACFDRKMPNTGSGLTLVHRHLINEITCQDCHEAGEDPQEPPPETCFSCHGTPEDIAARTAGMDPDPHNSPHYGTDLECSLCHHQHETSENFCADCHEWKLNVP